MMGAERTAGGARRVGIRTGAALIAGGLALSLLAACDDDKESTTATTAAEDDATADEETATTEAPAAADIAGEDALAAALTWDDVKRFVASGEDYWPEMPQFNTGLEPGVAPLATAVQVYDYVGDNADRAGATITSTVIAYADEATAKKEYEEVVNTSDADGDTVEAPEVDVDEFTMFTRDADGFTELTLRWRIGSAFGRLSAVDNPGFRYRSEVEDEEAELANGTWTPEALADAFEPVRRRVEKLINGDLQGDAVSDDDAPLLPPSGSSPGDILGTATVPAEAWASIDSSGDPEGVLARLSDGGAEEVLTRRYTLKGVAGNVVDVTVFPFSNEDAAVDWATAFPGEAPEGVTFEELDPGATGDQSAFINIDDGAFFELQFAKGDVVADIACSAPFDDTSSKCEAAVLKLAEAWFQALG